MRRAGFPRPGARCGRAGARGTTARMPAARRRLRWEPSRCDEARAARSDRRHGAMPTIGPMTTDALNGKVAFITGAGSGLGAALARALAAAGALIVVNDVNSDAAARTAAA